ncbi:TlpA family protein disulfide reductase [Cohnella suwonensis]|uniref:TlpA family protein disulfide reductase n=1 Tax=Cohnella suwonensis TaxID=696072 RepID=A0ABW0M3D0_9BACL
MRKLQVVSSYLVLLIAFCAIVYSLQANKSKLPGEDTDIAAPVETTATQQHSEEIVLEDLLYANPTTINYSEKPTAILFFTSWCPYCNEDAPKVVQLYNKYKEDVNLYGVNLIYRDDRNDVEAYVNDYQIKYPILMDESGSLYDKYGGSGFPSLYFFNADGEVIDQIIGSTDLETIEDSFISLQENFKA